MGEEVEGMRLAVGMWEVREDWGFCGLGVSVEGLMGGGGLREETGGEEVERSCRDDCELGRGVGRGSER